MRWISYSIPVALIGLSAVIWQMDSLPFRAAAQTSSQAAKHKPKPAQRKIFAAGVVEGTNRQVPLRFEIAGRLVKLHVVEGSTVRKGEPLARLDDTTLRQTLVEAESKLALARGERERLVNGSSAEARKVAKADALLASVRVEHAKSEVARAENAFAQEALTAQELETYRFQLKRARAEAARAQAHVAEVEAKARPDDLRIADARILIAQAAVDRAKVMLAKMVLRAPVDGVVLRVDAEPGEMTGPDTSLPVLTFADDALIHVRAYVEELDALSLHIGQQANVVADGLPDKRYAGKIVWLAPSMHEKTVRHRKPGEHIDVKVREIRILIDDPQRLVFGLPVEVFLDPPDKSLITTSPLDRRVRTPREAELPSATSGGVSPHQTPKER